MATLSRDLSFDNQSINNFIIEIRTQLLWFKKNVIYPNQSVIYFLIIVRIKWYFLFTNKKYELGYDWCVISSFIFISSINLFLIRFKQEYI